MPIEHIGALGRQLKENPANSGATWERRKVARGAIRRLTGRNPVGAERALSLPVCPYTSGRHETNLLL